jgi:hypothetical protein
MSLSLLKCAAKPYYGGTPAPYDTGHPARLGTRLLARLYRGDHPKPPDFTRFSRRNPAQIPACAANVPGSCRRSDVIG